MYSIQLQTWLTDNTMELNVQHDTGLGGWLGNMFCAHSRSAWHTAVAERAWCVSTHTALLIWICPLAGPETREDQGHYRFHTRWNRLCHHLCVFVFLFYCCIVFACLLYPSKNKKWSNSPLDEGQIIYNNLEPLGQISEYSSCLSCDQKWVVWVVRLGF